MTLSPSLPQPPLPPIQLALPLPASPTPKQEISRVVLVLPSQVWTSLTLGQREHIQGILLRLLQEVAHEHAHGQHPER